MPIDRIGLWAEVLELNDQEAELFADLAAVSHLPREVRPRFEALVRKAQSMETRLQVAESAVERYEATLKPRDKE